MKKVYYKEFNSTDGMETFIHTFSIKEENIIKTTIVRKGLICMWHYV